ncbi:thioredoxin family protein [Hydrogenimonas sp.]
MRGRGWLAVPVICGALWAQSPEYLPYERARAVASERGKIVMVEATSPHCRYCLRMERTTLRSPRVVAVLKRGFVPVRINVSRGELPEGLTWRMTPTFFFLDGRGRLLKEVPGAWGEEDFLEILREVSAMKRSKGGRE